MRRCRSSRLIAASVLTGEDLKASNSFAAPATGETKTKFEVPAHSNTVIEWSL